MIVMQYFKLSYVCLLHATMKFGIGFARNRENALSISISWGTKVCPKEVGRKRGLSDRKPAASL